MDLIYQMLADQRRAIAERMQSCLSLHQLEYNDSTPFSAAYVTFEPGAHTAWHIHPAGQRLIVTAGVGLIQEWGGPVIEVHAGDVIWCPPGVKHWHGASPTTSMTHIALTGVFNEKVLNGSKRLAMGNIASKFL